MRDCRIPRCQRKPSRCDSAFSKAQGRLYWHDRPPIDGDMNSSAVPQEPQFGYSPAISSKHFSHSRDFSDHQLRLSRWSGRPSARHHHHRSVTYVRPGFVKSMQLTPFQLCCTSASGSPESMWTNRLNLLLQLGRYKNDPYV